MPPYVNNDFLNSRMSKPQEYLKQQYMYIYINFICVHVRKVVVIHQVMYETSAIHVMLTLV